MEQLKTSSDVLFILLGAIMVLAMHAGFAFLELGTVRRKNQVNALAKILTDLSASTVAYFFIGYGIAYGVNFFLGAEQLTQKSGYDLVKFFFLLTFAAAIPAIVSGGIAERAKFNSQLGATFLLVAFVYPFFEGIAWNNQLGFQDWLQASFSAKFHDFAGSVVVRSGRLDRACGGDPARCAHGSLRQGPGRNESTIEHSFPRIGGLDSVGGLVRLQRDVGADHRRDQWTGGGEFADGDGRRHARRARCGPERSRFCAQRAARGTGRDLCWIRCHASAARSSPAR
jgi:hypothetical protein